MITCYECGVNYSFNDLLSLDQTKDGYWCDMCDHFNYYKRDMMPNSLLILEKKELEESMPYEKPKIKLKKRLSPLRYPGGKSKMIDYLYSKMRTIDNHLLISPFIGGGSFELSLLESEVVSELYMNDYDYGVYSFWDRVTRNPENLIERISTLPSKSDFYKSQREVLNGYKNCKSKDDAAYAFFIVNRLAYSGIPFANIMGGKDNPDPESHLARWNSESSISKILYIHETLGDKITVHNLDFSELMQEYGAIRRGTIFIDPPYYVKGDDLYVNKMSEDMHTELAYEVYLNRSNYALSDLIITYDFHEEIERLYHFIPHEIVGRRYSI